MTSYRVSEVKVVAVLFRFGGHKFVLVSKAIKRIIKLQSRKQLSMIKNCKSQRLYQPRVVGQQKR